MDNREKRHRGFWRLSLAAWTLAGLLILVMIFCLARVRNPWIVHELDAQTDISLQLSRIAGSTSPYVRIRGMDLTYTGYYELDSSGRVCAYCYFGEVGEANVLVSLPALDDGALSAGGEEAGARIEDALFSGRVLAGSEMTEHLARGEEMPLQDYIRQYHMSGLEIFSYGNDRERIIIYHLMILTGIAGCVAAGGILRAEARAAARAPLEEEADQSAEHS